MAMTMWGHDRLYLSVLQGAAPTDPEWDRWITMSLARVGLDQRVIVESHNSGPNATQRKSLADAMRNEDVRVAVLTESTLVRGIVTALAWLGIPQRAFPMDGHRQAGKFLELTPDELERALAELPRLRDQAGVNETKQVSRG
jgi:hypothetical protein